MSFVLQKKGQLLYIMGFAGSGKTTLTSSFARYLQSEGNDVAIVNLDPGAEKLPYEPDFDVREIVKLRDIMIKERLGPNGGLIRSIELIVENINAISEKIRQLSKENDWVLIDTTGQLELFAFRDLGEKLVSMLKDHVSMGVFLIDATSLTKPSDIVMTQLLSLAIQYKLGVDIITILNKIDVSDIPVKHYLETLYFDPESFKQELNSSEQSIIADLSSELIDILIRYLPATRIIAISAKNNINLDELYTILHEIYCNCGDLT